MHQNKWPTDIFANLLTQYPEQTRKKYLIYLKKMKRL